MDILICSPSRHSTTTRQPFFSLLLLRLSDSVATFKIGKFLVSRFYTSRRTVTNWLSALADANSFPYDLSSRTLPSISPSSIRYFSLLSYLFLMFSPKTLFTSSLSRSDLSAKWRKSAPFHSESRNSSNRSTAFLTIIDFRNDVGVFHKCLLR